MEAYDRLPRQALQVLILRANWMEKVGITVGVLSTCGTFNVAPIQRKQTGWLHVALYYDTHYVEYDMWAFQRL